MCIRADVDEPKDPYARIARFLYKDYYVPPNAIKTEIVAGLIVGLAVVSLFSCYHSCYPSYYYYVSSDAKRSCGRKRRAPLNLPPL